MTETGARQFNGRRVLAARDGWTLTQEPLSGPHDNYIRHALRGLAVTPEELAALREFRAPNGHPAMGVRGGVDDAHRFAAVAADAEPGLVVFLSLTTGIATGACLRGPSDPVSGRTSCPSPQALLLARAYGAV